MLSDPAGLKSGIDEMEKRYEEILEPKRQRLKTMGERIHRTDTRMGRRIAELGDEDNPTLRGLLKEKPAAEAKARDVWVAERESSYQRSSRRQLRQRPKQQFG